jgi:hypothetical protein
MGVDTFMAVMRESQKQYGLPANEQFGLVESYLAEN